STPPVLFRTSTPPRLPSDPSADRAASRAFARSFLPRRWPDPASSSGAPAPVQPSGITRRSRSRRLRRRVRDHPPSACGFRSGGHEARERSTQDREGAGAHNNQQIQGEQLSEKEV